MRFIRCWEKELPWWGHVASGANETMKYDPRNPVWVINLWDWRFKTWQNTGAAKVTFLYWMTRTVLLRCVNPAVPFKWMRVPHFFMQCCFLFEHDSPQQLRCYLELILRVSVTFMARWTPFFKIYSLICEYAVWYVPLLISTGLRSDDCEGHTYIQRALVPFIVHLQFVNLSPVLYVLKCFLYSISLCFNFFQ